MPRFARPVVGIVGAGQLARMTAQAAIALDIEVRVLAATPDDAAALVVPATSVGDLRILDDLAAFAARCDVMTFDHEVIDPVLLQRLAQMGHTLRPPPDANRYAQDKGHQRTALGAAGLPVPRHALVDDAPGIVAFAGEVGWPVVCKAVRGGYDGRGVWSVDGEPAAVSLIETSAGQWLLVEERVPIERELAVLVVRRPGGEAAAYPVVETVQDDTGMLRELVVPAPVPDAVAAAARTLALDVAEHTGSVGVLAVELFWTGDRLLVNELAARPHNSGHWTIEAAATSQFENHLRAVLDWPLGATEQLVPAVVTVNVVGPAGGADPRTLLPVVAPAPATRIHLYDKAPRPGRKLGHVTAFGHDVSEVRTRARRTVALLTGEEPQ